MLHIDLKALTLSQLAQALQEIYAEISEREVPAHIADRDDIEFLGQRINTFSRALKR